ncbi:MAG: methyltransferase, partial [Clostridiales bacterium]|nr:methyltransferase [Clostridiales bacterium]
MTHKQRVAAALRHRKPDRAPRFIWLGDGVIERLTKKLGITPLELDIRLGNDVLQSWVSINREMERKVPDKSEFVDEWGITWRRDGHYNMVVRHPLAGRDAAFIKAYPLPQPFAADRFAELDGLLLKYGEEYFIGADVSGTLFEPACHLRGMEEFLVDLISDDGGEARILLDRLEAFSTDVAIASAQRGVDWVWLGDDLGSQSSMMMSPDLWRAHFKPRMKRIIDAVRARRPDIFIAYHSCGSMAPVIGDLAEIGVDVLNPIQESAASMDQMAVKNAYGDRLALMCGPDT